MAADKASRWKEPRRTSDPRVTPEIKVLRSGITGTNETLGVLSDLLDVVRGMVHAANFGRDPAPATDGSGLWRGFLRC